MKKLLILLMLFICFSAFAYTEADITKAANQFGVPYADLKAFIKSYENTKTDVIKTSFEEIYKDYKANTYNADKKYENKVIEITATVSSICSAYRWNSNYSLVLYNEEFKAFGGTECYLKTIEEYKLADIQQGQTVTIRGIFVSQIAIKEVEIVKTHI